MITDLASDEELVSAAKAGDDRAMELLLERHYRRVWSICRRVARTQSDADDATQETLIRIVRYLPKFDERSKFSTWAYRIATNCAIDEHRKRARRRGERSLDQRMASSEDQAGQEPEDPRAQEPIEQLGDRWAFDTALASVDENYRIPLVMRDVGTLSYDEIAEQLGIPAGTVKSRIARGRQQLLQKLGPDGNYPGSPAVAQNLPSPQTPSGSANHVDTP